MSHCESCGRGLRAEAQFCPECGIRVEETRDFDGHGGGHADRPSGPSVTGLRRGVVPALAAAAAVVLVAGGVGIYLLARPGPSPTTPTSSPPIATTAPMASPPITMTKPRTATPWTSVPWTSTAPPTYVSDEQWLRDQAGYDYPTAEAYLGYWLPQVSSKRIGSDGYDAAAIVQDYRDSVESRPDTRFLLVGSDDFASFTGSGYWVTLAARPFSTAAEANAWCDAEDYPVQNCYAKRLSQTEGPVGNSVPRG